MYTLKVEDGANSREISATEGERLLDVLAKAGISVSAPCGGNGKCGKCRVRVSGQIEAGSDGYCLACRTYVHGDCTVYIEDTDAKVLVSGIETECAADGETGYGLAVDIGTTTVAGYIVELSSGKVVKSLSGLNPQRPHGADVISRLEYAAQGKENAELLKNEIDGMLTRFQNSGYNIRRCALVGNTVMMHLAGGYDSAALARAPFIPYYKASHNRLNCGVNTLFGGVISGYVGADTLAATLACGMDEKDETALMIDIGTNGEIVLKHRGKLLSCSCAAGPAFEGAHICCGTGAVDGAIDHVRPDGKGRFTVSTIGGVPATGICGSGLVDTIAYLLDEELISPVGRMESRLELTKDIYIDPKDVREVQLAKAAISAGIRILMDRLGADFDDIAKVYLAGGFGNYIDVGNACKIGLLPQELLDVITPVGNAAGTGARMLLVSEAARKRYEQLRGVIDYIELSTQDDFEDEFSDCLIFGNDD